MSDRNMSILLKIASLVCCTFLAVAFDNWQLIFLTLLFWIL